MKKKKNFFFYSCFFFKIYFFLSQLGNVFFVFTNKTYLSITNGKFLLRKTEIQAIKKKIINKIKK